MPDKPSAQPKPGDGTKPESKPGNAQGPAPESLPKRGEPVPVPIVTKPGAGSG